MARGKGIGCLCFKHCDFFETAVHVPDFTRLSANDHPQDMFPLSQLGPVLTATHHPNLTAHRPSAHVPFPLTRQSPRFSQRQEQQKERRRQDEEVRLHLPRPLEPLS